MPALTEVFAPTERDLLNAKESARQIGGVKSGRKESVAIPSRHIGTHPQALTADALAYKQREKEARLAVLDELAAEGRRLKLGA